MTKEDAIKKITGYCSRMYGDTARHNRAYTGFNKFMQEIRTDERLLKAVIEELLRSEDDRVRQTIAGYALHRDMYVEQAIKIMREIQISYRGTVRGAGAGMSILVAMWNNPELKDRWKFDARGTAQPADPENGEIQPISPATSSTLGFFEYLSKKPRINPAIANAIDKAFDRFYSGEYADTVYDDDHDDAWFILDLFRGAGLDLKLDAEAGEMFRQARERKELWITAIFNKYQRWFYRYSNGEGLKTSNHQDDDEILRSYCRVAKNDRTIQSFEQLMQYQKDYIAAGGEDKTDPLGMQLNKGDLLFWKGDPDEASAAGKEKKSKKYWGIRHVSIYAGEGLVLDNTPEMNAALHPLSDIVPLAGFARPTSRRNSGWCQD
jgi:hypothetical protein